MAGLHRWSITEGLRRIDLDREDPPVPPASAALQMIRQADRGVSTCCSISTPTWGMPATSAALPIQRRHSEPHVLVLIGAKVELPAGWRPWRCASTRACPMPTPC